MRIGLVGIGRIGVFHAATLKGLDSVEQVVVADADSARAQAAAKELDCEAAVDVEALFRGDRCLSAGVLDRHADRPRGRRAYVRSADTQQ